MWRREKFPVHRISLDDREEGRPRTINLIFDILLQMSRIEDVTASCDSDFARPLLVKSFSGSTRRSDGPTGASVDTDPLGFEGERCLLNAVRSHIMPNTGAGTKIRTLLESPAAYEHLTDINAVPSR